jgi:hypothetical protein
MRLVDAIAATMRSVFPNVYTLDLPGRTVRNTLVIATVRPSSMADFRSNVPHLEHPVLRHLADYASNRAVLEAWEGEGLIFTDDRAPVEYVVDQMILNYVQGD